VCACVCGGVGGRVCVSGWVRVSEWVGACVYDCISRVGLEMPEDLCKRGLRKVPQKQSYDKGATTSNKQVPD